MSEKMTSRDIARAIVDANIYRKFWNTTRNEWPVSEQGRICPAYCNLRTALGNVTLRNLLQEQLVLNIEDSFVKHGPADAIVGLVSAGVPWASHVSDQLRLPMAYVRPTLKTHGKGGVIEGQLEPGMSVHVIDDVFLTGNTVTKSSLFLANEGVSVAGITTLLQLSNEVAEIHQLPDLALRPAPTTSLSHYADLVDISVEQGDMNQDQGERLKYYYGNPTSQPWD